jgi:hypothetical protein
MSPVCRPLQPSTLPVPPQPQGMPLEQPPQHSSGFTPNVGPGLDLPPGMEALLPSVQPLLMDPASLTAAAAMVSPEMTALRRLRSLACMQYRLGSQASIGLEARGGQVGLPLATQWAEAAATAAPWVGGRV